MLRKRALIGWIGLVTMTGHAAAIEVRAFSPTRVYASQPDHAVTGRALPEPIAILPAGTRFRTVEPAMSGWLRICVTLGGEALCGFVEAAKTNYSPGPAPNPGTPSPPSGQ